MYSRIILGSVFIICCLTTVSQAAKSDGFDQIRQRAARAFSLFQIIQFPNDPCVGSTNKNGTCYTSDECSSRGGTNSGSCASGYGVCCTFSIRCGATSSQNCTFFESAGGETGSCSINVCPCDSNICQLRLDFNTFSISGPSTATATSVQLLNGQVIQTVAGTNGAPATAATQCLTDSFTVTNTNGRSPSTICGVNTGEHLYVDASNSCNQLAFQLASAAATTITRSWSIKVTQYSCDYPNLAPNGCDQYFFGATTNTVRSFNYNGGNGYHLARQDQNICVRRERGTCRICWSAINNIDFMLSGMAAGGKVGTGCCGYGNNGKVTTGYDCVMIPSATKQATAGVVIGANAFCGRSSGLASQATGAAKTVCSRRTPFQLRFLSDQYEFQNEAAKVDRGFQLAYILTGTNC